MKKFTLLWIIILVFLLSSCDTILKIREWNAKIDFYLFLFIKIIGVIGVTVIFINEFYKKKKNDE